MRALRPLVAAGLAAVLLAACGGGSDQAGEVVTGDAGPEPGATQPGAKSQTETVTGDGGGSRETGTGRTGGEEGGADPDPARGEQVFAGAGCGGCHTLAAAGSEADVGPNLDDAKPEFDDAVEQITEGGGAMPAYEGRLTAREIQSVAAYVVESTGG